MALPIDSDVVHKAFRLGWYVAEVRGRNRPGGPVRERTRMPGGDTFPLPLRIERTAVELRIESQCVLTELAVQLCVDIDDQGGSFGKRIDEEAHQLADRKPGTDPAPNPQWDSLAKLLWQFDAHVQDALTARSELQACAYQLGRGLAETYWALDPEQADGPRSWGFLLSDVRCSELTRLLGRMSAYLNTYTGSAIGGSIEIWKDYARGVATDLAVAKAAADELRALERTKPAVAGPDITAAQARAAETRAAVDAKLGRTAVTIAAQDVLRNQIRRWYELIALAQDPTTLMKPFVVLRSFRTLKQAVRQFWPQVAVMVFGLGFLIGFLVLLSLGAGSDLVKTLGAVLGGFGLTVGGITGALKNSAQSLLVRLRQDTYTELIAEGVTAQPPAMSRSAVREAIARRELTPITPG